ncbi:type II toxin-antitoxin system HigB family toxin [Alteromonas lipotrueiana]|uniref:type II toxin-antitoxin system HigB family toxin n=1 Tax=Alteromonas lipotrueiana TaxID=2803815 RepID=UPI001C43FFBC|nr:type II toxin-antitoxin system HigB family toxin [Alteromonas lipotrueiana]
MQVIRQDRLADFSERYAEKRIALQCWLAEVKEASWCCADDVLKDYKGAKVSDANEVTFVVGRGTVEVVTKAIFRKNILRIDEIGLSV